MARELECDGTTGTTVYFQLRNSVGQIWRVDTLVFENYLTANIAHYNIAATEQGSASGFFTADMPGAVAGEYNVIAKQQAGGSPAESDRTVATGEVQWSGTAIVPLSAVGLASSQGAVTFTGAVAFQSTFAITGNLSLADGITITCTTTNRSGITSTGNGLGHGLRVISGNGATGDGFRAESVATDGNGAQFIGHGSGDGAQFLASGIAGGTGHGIHCAGGGTSGDGINSNAAGANGNGLSLNGTGTGDGLAATGGSTGRGIHCLGGSISGAAFRMEAQGGNANGAEYIANGTGKDLFLNTAGNNTAISATLTAAGLDAVLIESGIVASASLTNDAAAQLTSINARQALSLVMSTTVGILAGAATTTVTTKPAGLPSGNTRCTATVDANGNRSAETLVVPT